MLCLSSSSFCFGLRHYRDGPFCEEYALVVGGQILLFAAMDRLRAEDRLALAYPIAIGVSMVAVALWDRMVWKIRPDRTALAGILLGLLGVILLAL